MPMVKLKLPFLNLFGSFFEALVKTLNSNRLRTVYKDILYIDEMTKWKIDLKYWYFVTSTHSTEVCSWDALHLARFSTTNTMQCTGSWKPCETSHGKTTVIDKNGKTLKDCWLIPIIFNGSENFHLFHHILSCKCMIDMMHGYCN